MVSRSDVPPAAGETRPYRSFNETVEELGRLVRALYRDVAENITGTHPRVYRQVAAGCEVGVVAEPRRAAIPARYRDLLGGIPFIRQVLMYPPLMIDPPDEHAHRAASSRSRRTRSTDSVSSANSGSATRRSSVRSRSSSTSTSASSGSA